MLICEVAIRGLASEDRVVEARPGRERVSVVVRQLLTLRRLLTSTPFKTEHVVQETPRETWQIHVKPGV